MEKLTKIFLFVFIVAVSLSVSYQAFAAPVITSASGTFTTGSTITVSGSGFGTKTTAVPLKYDAFESGTAGQDLGNGWVFSTSDDRNPKYSAKFLRPNSTMSGMADFSGNQYLSSFGVRDMTNGYPEVYMDFWYLYDPASPPSRNHKLFRFYTGFDSSQPDRYMNVYCGTGWTMESDGGGTSNWYGSPWWEWTNADKQWSHFQGYFKTNTDGASNGIIKFWIDHIKGIDASNWVHRPSGQPFWYSLWFGNYLGHDAAGGCGVSPGDSFTFWDNVYIDTTQARVEIGDAANYESSTHREIQIPSLWADGSLNYTVNNGSFTSGQQAYLFVFDSNGVVNASGYPITIGGAPVPDTTAPSIPTNLSATAISSSQIDLSWTASTDAVGVSGYIIYQAGTQIAVSTTTSYSNTGLSPSTSYSYTVSAYDVAGNVSGQSGSSSATTQAAPVPDTTAPSIPTNLSATAISSSQIDLSWTASTDNVGVAGYQIYRCTGSGCTPTTQIATSATNSYQNTGLTANTTYVYRVAAYDAAGNVSGQSGSASATTQAVTSGGGNSYGVGSSANDFIGFAWGGHAMGWISFNWQNCDTDQNGTWDACGLSGPSYEYRVYVLGTLPNAPPTAANLESNFLNRCASPFSPQLSFYYKDNEGDPLEEYIINIYDDSTGTRVDGPIVVDTDPSLYDPLPAVAIPVTYSYTGTLQYGSTYYFTVEVRDEAHLN